MGDINQHKEPIMLSAEAACPVEGTEPSFGQVFSNARERRGLTLEQAAHDVNVAASYLKTIEAGDYSGVSDMLYILPFLQRYATFLGLDVKEVTARFRSDFEAAENAPIRIPPPPRESFAIPSLPWPQIAQVAAIAAVAVLLAGLAFVLGRSTAQKVAEVSPRILTSLPPPMRVKYEPSSAVPQTVAELPDPAPTAAQLASKASRRPKLRGVSSPHHHRHNRTPG